MLVDHSGSEDMEYNYSDDEECEDGGGARFASLKRQSRLKALFPKVRRYVGRGKWREGRAARAPAGAVRGHAAGVPWSRVGTMRTGVYDGLGARVWCPPPARACSSPLAPLAHRLYNISPFTYTSHPPRV